MYCRKQVRPTAAALLGLAFWAPVLAAPSGTPEVPAFRVELAGSERGPDLREFVNRYSSDRGSLLRQWGVPYSTRGAAVQEAFYRAWTGVLESLDFGRLSREGQVDAVLFRHHLEAALRDLQTQARQRSEVTPLIPFIGEIVGLEESRRDMKPLDPGVTASLLDRLRRAVDESRGKLDGRESSTRPTPVVANRAAGMLDGLRGLLRAWYGYYNGYDPVATWWLAEPVGALEAALQSYATLLRERYAGVRLPAGGEAAPTGRFGRGGGGGSRDPAGRQPVPVPAGPIIGDPIGREALLSELAAEMIPYSPEELIEIARKEQAWCEVELKKAARELGCGDDWRRAVEMVKQRHVEPGKQPDLIRELALEAVAFLEQRDLVTIPDLCKQTWRMEMMSPERQLVSPFFTGGEVISVSYPTQGMSHEQKLMSMRGNNKHFSRATVQHELIPGHHLQGFMADRYRTHRRLFSTPFLTEGWALYWELLLWDLDFARTPEDRVGMLFWRTHRCARIIFSLSFHLGKMSPQQCIDMLVERVGHERENAVAEVRRSFSGQYPPLYQAAYLLGGLQLRSLHAELVATGRMTPRQFHDAVLKENRIPVEMIRASLANLPLRLDYRSSWRFYPDR